MGTEEREPLDADKHACVRQVRDHFPDICLDFLHSVAAPLAYKAEQVINHVLERQDSGDAYPTAKTEILRTVKRGYTEEEEREMLKKHHEYSNPDRPATLPRTPSHNIAKKILAGEFPRVPMKSLVKILSDHKNHLYPAYFGVLDTISNSTIHGTPLPWTSKKHPSPLNKWYAENDLATNIPLTQDPTERELMGELLLARIARDKGKPRVAVYATRCREALNLEQAMASGEVAECECCFAECPLNRLIHCDGEQAHMFCPRCCETNVETQIGLSKYELQCMSTEGCSAGFSVSERAKFLSVEHVKALDRIEKEAVLRIADIANLAKCPFCPYAEVYPLIDIVQEFRCQGPDCGKVSCRLCNMETHLPMSCEEATHQRGTDLRHTVEEAMSEALIRKCNKCHVPFIKEHGCNKMTCPRPACRNIQCYVCSENCDYKHFEKGRKCALFDSVEDRHQEEVDKAGKAAADALLGANPYLKAENLALTMSTDVEKDDLKRKQNDPFVNQDLLYIDGVRVNGQAQADRDRAQYQADQNQRREQRREAFIDRMLNIRPGTMTRRQVEQIWDAFDRNPRPFLEMLIRRQQALQNGDEVPEEPQDIPAVPNVGNQQQIDNQGVQQQNPVAQIQQQQQPDQRNLFQGPQGQANGFQRPEPANINGLVLQRSQDPAMGNANRQLTNHRGAQQQTPTRQNQQRSQGLPPQAAQGPGPQTGPQIQGQQPARPTLQRIRQRRALLDTPRKQTRQGVTDDGTGLVGGQVAHLALNNGQGQGNNRGQIGDSPSRHVTPVQQQQPAAQAIPQFNPYQFIANSGMGQQGPQVPRANNQFRASQNNQLGTGQAQGQFGARLNMGQQVPRIQLNQSQNGAFQLSQFGGGQTRNRAWTGPNTQQQAPGAQPNQGQNGALQLNQFGEGQTQSQFGARPNMKQQVLPIQINQGQSGALQLNHLGGEQIRNRAWTVANTQQQAPGAQPNQGQNGAPQNSHFGTGQTQNQFDVNFNMGPQTLRAQVNQNQNRAGHDNPFGMAQAQGQLDTGPNLQQQAPRFQYNRGQNEAGENPNPFGAGFNMGPGPQ